jgi:carbonic anhydrase
MSKGIQNLIDLNKEHSRLFSDPGTAAARRQYRAQHPTEIGSLKCMDGRLHLPVATKTPLGIIQPWRNVGGKFDIAYHKKLRAKNFLK